MIDQMGSNMETCTPNRANYGLNLPHVHPIYSNQPGNRNNTSIFMLQYEYIRPVIDNTINKGFITGLKYVNVNEGLLIKEIVLGFNNVYKCFQLD